jgi:Mn2+/Fe2+ NRAMP family transporter
MSGFTSFSTLYNDFEMKAGKTAALGLALGLFAAGFASTITAPYGSAIISRTVFEAKEENKVRMVWIGVLMTGFIIGISGVNPIPVIVIVQALNGLILPMLVIFFDHCY